MAGSHDLQMLRHRVGALTVRMQEKPKAIITFGDDAIDSALPDHGLQPAAIHELLPVSQDDFGATLGFGLGLLTRLMRSCPLPLLWIAPSCHAEQHGLVYPVGFATFGFDPGRLICLTVDTVQDVLWAVEEGLTSAAFAAVAGILPHRDKSYDFTASRRLSLRAAAKDTTAFLVRHHASADKPTAAATRWSIATRPSAPAWRHGLAMPGIGPPRWQINLRRCKRGMPRDWLVEWNHETLSFNLASPLADRVPAVGIADTAHSWRRAS